MNPEQPGIPPPPANDYDFIVNPKPAPKKSLLGGPISKNPFILKLIMLVGGAVVLMIVAAVVLNLFFGSKTNLTDLATLTATEQELIRISTEGKHADDQAIRNAAINTQLTVKTHQQSWVAFLGKYGQKLSDEQLALKKDSATDKKLALAKQTSTFDPTFTTTMRSQLEAYGAAIKNAYNGATNTTERNLLDKQYTEIKLLLEQWPS